MFIKINFIGFMLTSNLPIENQSCGSDQPPDTERADLVFGFCAKNGPK